MTDAELIYNACLRAERRLEAMCNEAIHGGRSSEITHLSTAFCAMRIFREEVGRGLSEEGR